MEKLDRWLQAENKKVLSGRPVTDKFTGMLNEPVDIIIPFHGQYNLLTECIRSIFTFTSNYEYKITLVDDASKNKNYLDELSTVEGINIYTNQRVKIFNCLRNETHAGFVKSLKLGFENTSNPWVVFMNSDVHLQDAGWLSNLYATFVNLQNKNVQLVSARNNNPCGSELMSSEDPHQEDIVLENDFVSLECVFFPRQLIKEIGFFRDYYPGWYEDEEFYYRMKVFGYNQAICGKCSVIHKGQATLNALWRQNPRLKKLMKDNRKKCIEDIKLDMIKLQRTR